MKYKEMKMYLLLLNKNMNLIKRNNKKIEGDIQEDIKNEISSLKRGRNRGIMI